MKILHAFEVRDPGTPTRLEVHIARQIDTAMQIITSGLEVSGNPLLCVRQVPILR